MESTLNNHAKLLGEPYTHSCSFMRSKVDENDSSDSSTHSLWIHAAGFLLQLSHDWPIQLHGTTGVILSVPWRLGESHNHKLCYMDHG